MTSGTYSTSLPSAEYETSNCLCCVTPTSLSLFFKFSPFFFCLLHSIFFLFRHVFAYWFYFLLSLLYLPSDILSVFDFFSFCDLLSGYVFFSLPSLRSFSVLISFLCLLLWIFLYFRLFLTSHSISASLFDVSLYYLSLFLFLLNFLLFFSCTCVVCTLVLYFCFLFLRFIIHISLPHTQMH